LAELGLKAQEKGVRLSVRLLTPVPERVQSDPVRIRQVVLNLLSNAVKFTEQGSVEVVLACTDGVYTVEVNDTGIGMDPAQVETMFDPFTQADASIARRFGGTGLGLAISRRLARALGGELTGTSRRGVGTSMIFSFATGALDDVRLLDGADIAAAPAREVPATRTRVRLPSARVLVVDDGPENRELVSLVLTEHGLWIEEAENGQVALDKVAAGSYDVVLMDIQMPVMDGYTAAGELRRRGVQVPIVALTAHAMKGFEQEVLQAGFSAYLVKPVDIDALLQLLAQLLGGSTEVVAAVPVAIEASDEHHGADEGPIRSRFAGNRNLVPIVRKFAARLAEQLGQARAAADAGDLPEVQRLAHWLAGAAGTVGYDAFTEPARDREAAAKAGIAPQVDGLLQRLARMERQVEIPDVVAG
ncbi:MAG TPA: response regulator, partial [Ramlibacter sp.]